MRMMKQTKVLLSGITLAMLLSACGTTGVQAPVVERPQASGTTAASAARDRDPAMYTVRRGDTLLRIAQEHGQNFRDLVVWNNLGDPNDIKVDQVLRVLPPTGDTGGAQTSAIVMPAVTEVRPAAPAVPKKTGPRGEKRPYSDATLAELRSDAGVAEVPPAAPPAAPLAVPAKAAVATSGTGAPAAAVVAAGEEKLSWMWPSEGKVIGTFDEGKNKGVDIAGKAGQQVVAAGAGKVMYAGSGIRGYGNLVIVKHSNSLLSAYAHNRSILVKEGQSVNKGQAIAEMGDSDADRVKLHFEIRQQGKPVDPSKFLPNR
ncbi:lipoprotein NlpD [Janthinobacterium psychrotolerans]|uniref:Lipoprotein NlpD n=2 Tax=Janthinobacterium psychrotolerans TaxID=1747903 RepID=A0A1A7BTA7_9BURK|nr:lipoprotein NlpD [Janthinobacterium psychrotolerans]